MQKIHPEVFRLHNNVYTKHSDRKLIHNLLYWNKKIPKDKKEVINQILTQLNEVYESLSPLVSMGITFDLWLVGGSVRDFVLGNENQIKDLDIMISFNHSMKPKVPKIETFLKKSGLDFNKQQIQDLIYREKGKEPFEHWKKLFSKFRSYKDRQKQKIVYDIALFDMLACALAQNFDLYEIYKPANEVANAFDNSDKYLDLRLNGVIKIKKDNWKWPADILITNYNIESFLSAFDFGICKVGFEVVRGSDLREQRFNFIQTPEELLKRTRVTSHFLKDVTNKEMSMYVTEPMSARQLKHSCEIHLEKLEKKYPWKIKIELEKSLSYLDPDVDQPKKEDPRQAYLDAFFMQRQLNKELQEKIPNVEIKKVKKI
jgi:hypothetical protein